MSNLTLIRGIVEDFERSTHTTGGHHHTSTAHLSIFKIDHFRVVLTTVTPSIISNGDEVVLAGIENNGQFTALACKNVSANWISPLKQQGCAFAILVFMAISSFLMFFLIIPILIGTFATIVACKIKKHDNALKKAHRLIQNAG